MSAKSNAEAFIVLNFLKTYLINGNKQVSENIFRHSFSLLKKMKKKNPVGVVSSNIELVKPFCEIKSLKIGGSNYKVPTEIHPARQRALAIKFLVLSSLERNEKFASKCIAAEIFDTSFLSSQSVKSCDDVHKIAEVNKVYVQYRN